MRRVTCFLALLGLVAGVSACSGAGRNTVPIARGFEAQEPLTTGMLGTHIKHVVIVVQENRSFNNLFAGYPGARSTMTGLTHDGKTRPLRQITFQNSPNLPHFFVSAVGDWHDGKMDGFDQYETSIAGPQFPAYAYVARSQVAPYWAMAKQYVLADRMFPTMFGESFTAHLDLIAGNTLLDPTTAEADQPTAVPWGCDAPQHTTTSIVDNHRKVTYAGGPFPCFTNFRTIADSLDAKNIGWKYYAPPVDWQPGEPTGGVLWSIFDAISQVRNGPDWARVISPQTTVLSDIASGNLGLVNWVVPDFQDSDHADSLSDTGPSWVASIVNGIGASKYWKDTAIVVLWDDWGGFYDNVPPPQRDFVGLGIRVPCIIISPYAKQGYVSHTTYEFASTLKFIERVYGLQPIGPPAQGYTDTRAASLEDVFDFTQKPRKFVPIPAKYPPSHFLQRAPSLRPPDND